MEKKKLKQENFLTLNYSGTKRIIDTKFSNRMQNWSNDVKSSNIHSKTGENLGACNASQDIFLPKENSNHAIEILQRFLPGLILKLINIIYFKKSYSYS